MTLAVAEMYVQGVSTRKVTKIVEQLCGLQVTSTVSAHQNHRIRVADGSSLVAVSASLQAGVALA
jgi:hypothetical protein